MEWHLEMFAQMLTFAENKFCVFVGGNIFNTRGTMSTAVLTNLLEYLYGTLSPSNMLWVGERLIEHA